MLWKGTNSTQEHREIDGEPFQSFEANLKVSVSMCENGTLKEKFICDKVVCGIAFSFVRIQFLKERDLTLHHTIEIAIV